MRSSLSGWPVLFLGLCSCDATGGTVARLCMAVLLTIIGCAASPFFVCLDWSLCTWNVLWYGCRPSRAVFQSVKEVLQSLVDDGLVSSDKCGVQTVFWCLPSETVQKVGWRSSPVCPLLYERWVLSVYLFLFELRMWAWRLLCVYFSTVRPVTCPDILLLTLSWPPRCRGFLYVSRLYPCMVVYLGTASQVVRLVWSAEACSYCHA